MNYKIKTLPNSNELIKLLRQQIIIESELDPKFVLNGESKHGTNLYQNTIDDIFKSFKLDDTFIIFELEELNGDVELYEKDEDNKLLNYTTFVLKTYIYGENSTMLSRKLKARLLSEDVITTMYDKGILIASIDDIIYGSDFINGVRWPRRDMSINVMCRFSFDKITKLDNYNEAAKLKVEKNKQ